MGSQVSEHWTSLNKAKAQLLQAECAAFDEDDHADGDQHNQAAATRKGSARSLRTNEVFSRPQYVHSSSSSLHSLPASPTL